METTERLYRSRVNKVIGGVAGGLADYFDIDVVLVRVVFVLLALFGGSGGLIYIIMWIIVPASDTFSNNQNHGYTDSGSTKDVDLEINIDEDGNEIVGEKRTKKTNSGLILGIILIFIGMLFLIDRIMPWYNITDFWPLLLVVVGVLMIKPDIFKPTKKQSNEI